MYSKNKTKIKCAHAFDDRFLLINTTTTCLFRSSDVMQNQNASNEDAAKASAYAAALIRILGSVIGTVFDESLTHPNPSVTCLNQNVLNVEN